jgi:hypothetical protein
MNSLDNRVRLRMTASEIAMGRFMRAPDHSSTDDFAEFEKSGEVEVGDSNLASEKEEKSAKRAPKVEPDPVEDEADDQDDQDDQDDADEGDDQDDAEDEGDKPKKSAKDHQIERLKREKADLARQLRARADTELLERIDRLEKGLPAANAGANQETGTPAPDPNDLEKYPLGHLDPEYIEDMVDWRVEKRAAAQADAVLQRQQEIDQLTPVLEKVDNLTQRGIELYDDFQESVVDSGMRGDWDLSQTTFEAAHDADNGVQILYELSQDKKEASRVAKLSPFQQLKFVADRDAEISKSKTPRRIPKAGTPPENTARGANSRTQINPATDNLDDFEKAWEADAKRSRR